MTNKIFKAIKDGNLISPYQGHVKFEKGDLFYEDIHECTHEGELIKTAFYYPFKGAQPIRELDFGKDNLNSFYFVDEYLEPFYETEHPKEYFLEKKYTQADTDKWIMTITLLRMWREKHLLKSVSRKRSFLKRIYNHIATAIKPRT
jgi:hypothetical protein